MVRADPRSCEAYIRSSVVYLCVSLCYRRVLSMDDVHWNMAGWVGHQLHPTTAAIFLSFCHRRICVDYRWVCHSYSSGWGRTRVCYCKYKESDSPNS